MHGTFEARARKENRNKVFVDFSFQFGKTVKLIKHQFVISKPKPHDA
jgi:hypothetical protein